MRFLFTCGGTAGHINPAIAVAGRLRELLPDSGFLFVGAEGNMEEELVPREGYEIKLVSIYSLHRSLAPKDIVHNIKAAYMLKVSARQSREIIKNFKPDVVIGTGGYVCYPVIRMAHKMGVPTLIHESNAVPGLTTKRLEGIADVIMVGFEESRRHYKNPGKVAVTGTPVRGDFLRWDKESAKKSLGIVRPLVVSFWGSLGAKYMNEITADFIKLNWEKGFFTHIHATGNGEEGLNKMYAMLAERGVVNEKESGIDIRPYIFDMPKVMAAADLIICRSGASTLGELTLMGKPAILVPSPYVTNNHQEKNAMVLGERGGAVVIRESECSGEILFRTVSGILSTPGRLESMSARMKELSKPDATDKITETILELAEKYGKL
jgi:UDP-N-acetylglucosamine--N-acetylmuramyl-(pentapeptide) pyrophosphoryl-undecaprenol N-acetylglucosamine transferase